MRQRYNILGYNKGIISDILRINTITVESVLIADNLVALKSENNDPILIVKNLNGGNSLILLV